MGLELELDILGLGVVPDGQAHRQDHNFVGADDRLPNTVHLLHFGNGKMWMILSVVPSSSGKVSIRSDPGLEITPGVPGQDTVETERIPPPLKLGRGRCA